MIYIYIFSVFRADTQQDNMSLYDESALSTEAQSCWTHTEQGLLSERKSDPKTKLFIKTTHKKTTIKSLSKLYLLYKFVVKMQ